MVQLLIFGSVFVCVAALIGGVAIFLKGDNDSVENRLNDFVHNRSRTQKASTTDVLLSPLNDAPGQIEAILLRYFNLRKYLDQAGIKTSTLNFLLAVGAFAGIGVAFNLVMAYKIGSVGVGIFGSLPFAAVCSTLPFLYLWFIRKKRMKKFGSQLPEALELVSRALRAGHSLPAGIQLVAQQMNEPLGPEFGKCYEQQNLGVPLEDSLRDMTERVPNLDLKFFVTAVVLQRQTGGDLAEILDKIGRLIRERFQIWGQIQALTGEGRLSGIVLLALPPALFLVMLKLNYDYVMMLFTDPLGVKMLIGGIIMQLLGAVAIKKIITIKV